MSSFNYNDIYIEAGKKLLVITVLSEKHCNFDCIFSPIGRSHNKVDKTQRIENVEASEVFVGFTLKVMEKGDIIGLNRISVAPF
ncbi:MAG: hypothetical protein WBA54_07030 [Acidaminobacteraceae bacterium]